jgi:hypothetical protein
LKYVILRFLVLSFILALAATGARASPETDFQAARDAYQKGKFERFYKLAARFPDDHLLTPYLRYWRLKAADAANTELEIFIQQYPDTPLSNR